MSTSVLERRECAAQADVAEQVLVYLRISEDRTGEEAGVDRQRADCLALCGRLGLPVSDEDVFMDNDTSAYLNKKRGAGHGVVGLQSRSEHDPRRTVVLCE